MTSPTVSKTAFRPRLVLAVLVGVVTLSACTSIGYRCSLDPSEQPESPTACAGMHDAMLGAQKNTGGRTSVFLDDQGRIVPPEVLEGRAAVPLAQKMAGPYHQPSGSPAFQQPKVYQAWSSAFTDAEGNLHDGHSAWFATPGRWNYGTLNASGSVGQNILQPTSPNDAPQGLVIPIDKNGVPMIGAQPQPTRESVLRPNAAVQNDAKQALNALSLAATSAGNQAAPSVAAPQSASGVTAPAVTLGN